MVRTQIQLTERQARKLRERARSRGVSIAELIRRSVERTLAEDVPDRAALYERAMRVVGRFSDRQGARDLSKHHDAYLDDAFEAPAASHEPLRRTKVRSNTRRGRNPPRLERDLERASTSSRKWGPREP